MARQSAYGFNSSLVNSTFCNPTQQSILIIFPNHFNTYCVLFYRMRGIFCPVAFERQPNDNWTNNIQSYELSFDLPTNVNNL